jgi:uncharacterized protein YjbI with pentapeptide repeats
MHDGGPCGRPIYKAPAGVDKTPVCLMHSRDPRKDDGTFQAEFQRILQQAGEGIADFTRFVFPSANYSRRSFAAHCIFRHATFTQAAHFTRVTFMQDAYFSSVRFARDADFRWARFTQAADFREATTTQAASFYEAVFVQGAAFSWARFKQAAYFTKATFTEDANFYQATFTQAAYFSGARFMREADFTEATFAETANFIQATFTYDADFSGATFTEDAHFNGATFTRVADFSRAKFLGPAEFRATTYRNNGSSDPSLIFSLAHFEKPEAVEFADVDLGQALFYRRDISKVAFSNVTWRRRENGRWMVFEEVVNLDHRGAEFGLRPGRGSGDERRYVVIAELYQQLKKNYEERRDCWTAGDFHYGQMEMKRLASPRRNPMLRWLHRNLGLVAWYKYASDYGESYVKPFLRLLLVLVVFSLMFPACGLHRVGSEQDPPALLSDTVSVSSSTEEISYANFYRFLSAYPHRRLRRAAAFFGQSLMTTVSVASLRRDFADYEPQSALGRFVALVELLLTSTLIVLSLLAVRRQFRR